MKLYAYPTGPDRLTGLFAAITDDDARRIHPEARPATVEELSAALVNASLVPAFGLRGAARVRRPYAEVSDFVPAERLS